MWLAGGLYQRVSEHESLRGGDPELARQVSYACGVRSGYHLSRVNSGR